MKTGNKIQSTALLCLLLISCIKDKSTTPIVDTTSVSSISNVSAIIGGNITKDGGAAIIDRGICWSKTSQVPEVSDNKIMVGTGTGEFECKLINLEPYTDYYVRAYAINEKGTSYGDGMSFTTLLSDIDGNIYETKNFGNQVWMLENLKTTTYNNGDPIGTTNPIGADYSNESTPKYQWIYDGDNINLSNYGRLYTWFVVNDSRNICPEGWHLPSHVEWVSLLNYIGDNGYGYGGDRTAINKSICAKSDWIYNTQPGSPGNELSTNNSTGFNAFPSGFHDTYGFSLSKGYAVSWWSSDYPISSPNNAYMFMVSYESSAPIQVQVDKKKLGLAVRCMKN
jgi:uncharacterized protein (TIGR02145 family)